MQYYSCKMTRPPPVDSLFTHTFHLRFTSFYRENIDRIPGVVKGTKIVGMRLFIPHHKVKMMWGSIVVGAGIHPKISRELEISLQNW